MKVKLALILGYFMFIVIAAGGLFVSRIHFAPRLVSGHLAPLFLSGTPLSALVTMLALGVLSGLIVGASFGIPLGFVVMSRPLIKALCLGIGAIAFSVLFWVPVLVLGTDHGSSVAQALPVLTEAFAFLGTLCIATSLTDHLARATAPRVRAFYGAAALLVALLLFHDIFLQFLPSVLEWTKCGIGESGLADCIRTQIEDVKKELEVMRNPSQ